MVRNANQTESLNRGHITNPLEKMEFTQCPLFTFQYLISGNYGYDSKFAEKDLKIKLLNTLIAKSKLPWSSLHGIGKCQGGVEEIEYNKLKNRRVNLPSNQFYNKISKIVIFRTSGKNGSRLVCHREGYLCHVLWIDWNLTSYDHGS